MNIEDHTALLKVLRASGRIKPDEQPEFETLTGGVSNRAVRVINRDGRDDWVLKQALGKLRVDVDWFSSPERINREAEGLSWLGRIIPDRVPALIFVDPARHILAMTAVPQSHENWKRLLLNGRTCNKHARGLRAPSWRGSTTPARSFPNLKRFFASENSSRNSAWNPIMLMPPAKSPTPGPSCIGSSTTPGSAGMPSFTAITAPRMS